MPKCVWLPPNSRDKIDDRCPHEALDGHDECIFHISIEEKEKNNDLRDVFCEKFRELIKNFSYDFRGFKFPGKFNFPKNQIRVFSHESAEKANFRWAEFGEDISFRYVYFKRGAIFDRATFRGKTDFSYAAFDDKSGFQSATFLGEVYFVQIRTSRRDTLDYSGLEGGPFEAGAPWLIFNKTVFNGPTIIRRNDLSNTRFQSVDLSNVSFVDSTINKTRFIDCKWGSGPESKRKYKRNDGGWLRFRQSRLLFDELLLRKYRSKCRNCYNAKGDPVEKVKLDRALNPGDIEILGLQLKQSLESMRDPITAGDFHCCSMEMKRMRAWDDWKDKNNKNVKFRLNRLLRASVLWFYKMINGYGERYGRTLMWLASLVVISWLYYFVSDDFLPNGWSPHFSTFAPVLEWSDYLLYSVQNILPLKVGQQFITPVGKGAKWLSFGQTFFGTTLFAFFILALRRRFKR